jgi:hypothetical protein
MHEPNRDGPLMPKIAPQPQNLNGLHGRVALLEVAALASLRRAIIHQNNFQSAYARIRRISSAAEDQSSRSGISTIRRKGEGSVTASVLSTFGPLVSKE